MISQVSEPSHTFQKPDNEIFETEFRPVKIFLLVAGRIEKVVGISL